VQGSKNEQRIALSQPRRLSKKKVIALISRYSQVFIFKHRNKHRQELKYHSIFILTYLVVLIIERKGKERKRINNTNQKSINGKTKKKHKGDGTLHLIALYTNIMMLSSAQMNGNFTKLSLLVQPILIFYVPLYLNCSKVMENVTYHLIH
jgi:hypothetical protein